MEKSPPFAELAARAARVNQQLLAAPIIELNGIVSPGGIGASQAGAGTPWHLGFELAGWRLDGEPVQTQELRVRRQIERTEIDAYRKSLPIYSVRRLRVRLALQTEFGRPQAWLEEIVGPVDDAELESRAAQLREPVIHDDPVFGACTLNRMIKWFDAGGRWMDRRIAVHLSAPDVDALPEVLGHAHAIWAEQARWNQDLIDRCAADLLALKNDTWLGDDETAFTAETFKARLSLQSLTVESDGSFSFWFDDGDLFWGHAIVVGGDLKQGIARADIAG
ncbi:MAG TPA: DUF2262 domain-containing protein [Burkholderiales bacterium]